MSDATNRKTSINGSRQQSSKSFILNIFKTYPYPKLKNDDIAATTALQKIFRCRHVANTQYYLTTATPDSCVRDILLEDSPYHLTKPFLIESLKAYSKSKDTATRNAEKTLDYQHRDVSRSRQTRDRRARVYIPPVPDNVKTVRDLDPTFFSAVEGRPIKYTMDKNDYVNSINECNQTQMTAGYLLDMVHRTMSNFDEEQFRYNGAHAMLVENEENFEAFMSHDYSNSKRIMKHQTDFAEKLRLKNEEFQISGAKWATVRRQLYSLEDRCILLKSYRNFLLLISPDEWLHENEISRSTINAQKPISDIHFFGRRSNANLDFKDSLELKVETFDEDRQKFPEPPMYFKHPLDLSRLLQMLAEQVSASWANAEGLTTILNKLRRSMQNTVECINKYVETLEIMKIVLEKDVQKEEERAGHLKSRAIHMIETNFYQAVSSEEATTINICLKDVYNKIVYEFVSFGPLEMMRALQTEYRIAMNGLDILDFETVKQAKKETYSNDIKAMIAAREAAIKLRNFERIFKKLKTCYKV